MNDKDSIVLDISKPGNYGNAKYFCNACNRKLFCNDKETQDYICIKCNITYYPNNEIVKKANNFETPGPETDSHGNIIGDNGPIISMLDNTPDKPSSTAYYGQQKLSASFEVLKRHGFRITSYEEK